MNPYLYKPSDKRFIDDKIASDVWYDDNQKISFLTDNDFDVDIVWEYEYNKNEDIVIKKNYKEYK